MDTGDAPKRLMDLTLTGAAGVTRGANVAQLGASGWIVMKADGTPIDSQEGAPMATDSTGAAGTEAAETVTVSKADYDALVAKAAKAGEFPPADDEDDEDDDEATEKAVKKAFDTLPEPVRKHFEQIEQRAADAEKIAKAATAAAEVERNARLDAEFVKKAEAFPGLPTTPDQFGPVLRSIHELLPADKAAEVERLLKSASEAGAFVAITKSFGASAAAPAGSAADRIQKAADAMRAADPTLTAAQATDRVLSTQADLASAYYAERV